MNNMEQIQNFIKGLKNQTRMLPDASTGGMIRTTPNSITRETPLRMVYSAYAMIPIKINTPTYMHLSFNESINSEGLDASMNLLDEVREMAHVKEFTSKQRIAQMFNIKVGRRGFHKGDLVVKKVNDLTKIGKLMPSW